MSILNVKNLSCQRGYNQLFHNLSFKLNSGDILRISGTNGSGKTSLLKILAGLNTVETGKIHLDKDLCKTDKYQQNILYLGHISALSGELNGLENLQYLTALKQTSKTQILTNALNKIGLKGFEYEHTSKLSAGQKRRVVLAQLFISKAKVWLLDEPFTALDNDGIIAVESRIKHHCETGGICLFTTHQKSILNQYKTLAL